MKKAKNALVILLLAALLVLGAFLPALIGRVQERAMVGEAVYAEVQPITLNIQELSSLERLEILQSGGSSIMELTAAQAGKTEAQVQELAEQALEPYLELLNVDLDGYECSCSAALCYQSDDSQSISFVVWSVNYYRNTDTDYGYDTIYLQLDEETGCPLYMEFSFMEDIFAQDDLSELLYAFASCFLDGLNLPEPLREGEELDLFIPEGWGAYLYTWRSGSHELSFYGGGSFIYIVFS